MRNEDRRRLGRGRSPTTRGGGGVLSFELRGDGDCTQAFVEGLRRFVLAPSLGGVESLVTLPAWSTHAALSAEERERAGVSDRLVRMAVGIGPAEELIADIAQALAASGRRRRAPAPRARSCLTANPDNSSSYRTTVHRRGTGRGVPDIKWFVDVDEASAEAHRLRRPVFIDVWDPG
ncbi:MAG: PLP-dependent transferase [bacterium]